MKRQVTRVAGGKNKSGESTITFSRKDFSKLEGMYMTEPILFSGTNMWVDAIKKTFSRDLITFKNPQDTKSIDRVFELVDKESFQDFFLDKAPRHLCIYGNAFGEPLLNEQKNYVSEVLSIDPKTIDFLKTDGSYTQFDPYSGRPIGYKQSGVRTADNVHDTVFFQDFYCFTEAKEFVPDDSDFEETESHSLLLHLHTNQVNRGEMGIGIVEPVYVDSELKENMEQAKTKSAYRQGYPVPVISYGGGKDGKSITSNMKEEAKRLGEVLTDEKTDYAFKPFYLTLETMESINKGSSSATDIDKMLLYSTNLQAAVLEIPLGVLLEGGSGGDIEPLIPWFEASLQSKQKSLQIENFINSVLKFEKFDQKVNIGWKEFTMYSAREKVMQVTRLGKSGLLDIKDNKTKKHVMKIAGVPYVEENI
jgi:hypothetical protein